MANGIINGPLDPFMIQTLSLSKYQTTQSFQTLRNKALEILWRKYFWKAFFSCSHNVFYIEINFKDQNSIIWDAFLHHLLFNF